MIKKMVNKHFLDSRGKNGEEATKQETLVAITI